jgi:hypothetical protein
MQLPDHELTVEAWALYHATRALNRALDWHFSVRFNPDEPGRPTAEQLLAPPANAAAAKTGREATLFEAHFGYHLAGLATVGLKKRLKADPSPEQLAEAMTQIAHEARVPLRPFIEYLKSAGPEHQPLARALEALA